MVTRTVLLVGLVLVLPRFGQSAEHPTALHELPFHDCGGLICIDVKLDNSTPRTLLLDTGNVNSTLTTDTAAALGWRLEPVMKDSKPVPGLQRSSAHHLDFAGAVLDTGFLVIDRSELGDSPPLVDGSIAYPIFKDRVLQIDYPHHTLRLSDTITAAKAPMLGASALQLVTFGKKGPPIVVGGPFFVNGKPVQAQIDTCFTGTVLVYDAALGKLGLEKSGHPEFFPNTDGGVNLLAASAKSIGFGDTELLQKNAALYFVGAGANPVHQPDGLFEATVGNALFARSVLTLNFHTMMLDVRPAG